MHVCLTGERQSGKSRAVNRIIEQLRLPLLGFRTRFLTSQRGSSELYMVPADEPDILTPDRIVARRIEGKMTGLTDRFDTWGVELLRRRKQTFPGLILMDECGHLEKNAFAFQAEIMACLDEDRPVLGVLRKDQAWHECIRSHPSVRVLTVTEENRADIDQLALELLRR